MASRAWRAGALAGVLATTPAWSQGVASDSQLPSVIVTGSAVPATAIASPQTVETRTAEDLRAQNLVNPEDALRYLPDLTVRKRYIGDRNALIGGRSFSTLQAGRALVLMDGYLLSNFLGRFDAPRWNMVAPEELARIDVLYGPYSALYPGNSIGTTVVLTTRRPTQFEASARMTGFAQRFDQYGAAETFGGYTGSAFVGDALESGLAWSLAVDHQDSTGQPMQYYTVAASPAGRFPAVAGLATPVTGVRFDTDPRGLARAVLGASSGAIDHTRQTQAKLRLGYRWRQVVDLDGFVAGWQNDSTATDRTFVRGVDGTPVWSGRVQQDGLAFMLPSAALAPNVRTERHLAHGFTARTVRAAGWNASLVYSRYRIVDDLARQALAPDPVAAGAAGTLTRRDGTGWQTLELQAVRPLDPDAVGWRAQALALGYHCNSYLLKNPIYAASDWRGPPGVLSQDVHGRTRLEALYAQDQWRLDAAWTLTLGARYEQWSAYDGGQLFVGRPRLDYPRRDARAVSPKASFAWTPADGWEVRAAYGRGVRFPTVVELFQGTQTATAIVTADPSLAPERSDSVELSLARRGTNVRWRASAFEDDVHDAIWNQTNTAVVPIVTNVQNVGRVRTRGVEGSLEAFDLGVPGLGLEANLAWTPSATILDSRNLASIGQRWPRIPRVRAALVASYRRDERWLASLAVRHSGRMYDTLDNSDANDAVFGSVSRYTVADLRIAYTFASRLEAALGVDNVTDRRYYQFHPFPARTVFAELRWSSGGAR